MPFLLASAFTWWTPGSSLRGQRSGPFLQKAFPDPEAGASSPTTGVSGTTSWPTSVSSQL